MSNNINSLLGFPKKPLQKYPTSLGGPSPTGTLAISPQIAFSSSSKSETAVTNGVVTLKTNGGPVKLFFMPDAGTGFIGADGNGQGSITYGVELRIYRDSGFGANLLIGTCLIVYENTGATTSPTTTRMSPGTAVWLDPNPPAGTHTYTLYGYGNGTAAINNWNVNGCYLVAQEMPSVTG